MNQNDDRPQINLILDAGIKGQKPAIVKPDSNRQPSGLLYETALKRWLSFPPDLIGLLLWSGSLISLGGFLGGLLAVIPPHPAYLLPLLTPPILIIVITAIAASDRPGNNPYLAPWAVAMMLFCLGLFYGVAR